uniref:Uncharacterized protein n=1 Tax=Pipistrellus kuhlii TaxID=59472 RepID=A0A7J7VBL5_PIPKU|nr:hypothetical protein mPipKuh1_008502 [Pipistrellus kuhlii]
MWPERSVGFPSLPLLPPAGFWSCSPLLQMVSQRGESPGGSGMFALLCPELLVDFGLDREYKLEGRREPFLVSIGVSEDQEYSETGDQKLGKEIPPPVGYWAKTFASRECHAPTLLCDCPSSTRISLFAHQHF